MGTKFVPSVMSSEARLAQLCSTSEVKVNSACELSGLSGQSLSQLCGSRKYPYPHHGGNWKFRRGGGGQRPRKFQGVV